MSDSSPSLECEPWHEDFEYIGDAARTLAEILEFCYDLIYITESKNLYVWVNGVYQYRDDDWINAHVVRLCKQRADYKVNDPTCQLKNRYIFSTGLLNKVIKLIKGNRYISNTIFKHYSNLINCKNGIFDMDTLEFRAHGNNNKKGRTKGYYPLIQLAVDYNPKAKCFAIIKFLTEIFGKEKLNNILEVIGSYITTGVEYQKIQMLYGFGANGKGVFAKLVTALLGKINVKYMTLRDLNKDKFSMAELEGILLNIVTDVNTKKIYNTGILKAISGSDDLMSHRKFVQMRMPFDNTCKLLLACNTVAESTDDTVGWWRRWMLYALTRTFLGRNKDANLIKKLAVRGELEGLLMLALNGLMRLRWRGGFVDEPVEVVREKWMLESDPLGKFLLSRCEMKGEVARTMLLGAFNEFRHNNNMNNVSETYLTQHLKKAKPEIELKRKRGLMPAKYIGISLGKKPATKINVNKLNLFPPEAKKNKKGTLDALIESEEWYDG